MYRFHLSLDRIAQADIYIYLLMNQQRKNIYIGTPLYIAIALIILNVLSFGLPSTILIYIPLIILETVIPPSISTNFNSGDGNQLLLLGVFYGVIWPFFIVVAHVFSKTYAPRIRSPSRLYADTSFLFIITLLLLIIISATLFAIIFLFAF